MKRYNVRYRSVNLIIIRKGMILLIKRSYDDPIEPGKWCIPGGQIDDNESSIDALKREIKEELNVKTLIYRFIGVNLCRNVMFNYYIGETEGTITLNNESCGYAWFKMSDLPRDILFNQRKIIRSVKQ